MPFVISGVAVFLVLAVLIISYICYRIVFGGGRYLTDPYHGLDRESMAAYRETITKNIDKLLSIPSEEVKISSHDGAVLFADYYETREGAPLEIQFHGYRSMGTHDFSGGALEALAMGHNLLLVDQRAHGRSGGKSITFGALESLDCIEWVHFARKRFGENIKIILAGISMGAATVLIASSKGLPENVRGIIADCPCSSAGEIVFREGQKKKLPMRLLMPFVALGARLFGRFRLLDTDVSAAVRHSRVPILLIHGEADDFVPCSMSEKIKGDCELVRFERFADARHGLSYIVDTERYVKLIKDFSSEVLK